MGLFGFIGSALSSAASWIGSTLSSYGSVIVSTVSKLGSAISSGISWAVGKMGDLLARIPEVLPKVSSFLSGLFQFLDFIAPNQKAEDLGERALQAREAGITLDNSKDFVAYMDKLRNFEIDPEKSAKRPQTEKLCAAMAVGATGIEHKFNLPGQLAGSLYLLPLVNERFFTPERVGRMLSVQGLVQDVFAYLDKKLTPDEGLEMAKQLHALEKRFDATADLAALRAELAQSRDMIAQLEARLAAAEQAAGTPGAGSGA